MLLEGIERDINIKDLVLDRPVAEEWDFNAEEDLTHQDYLWMVESMEYWRAHSEWLPFAGNASEIKLLFPNKSKELDPIIEESKDPSWEKLVECQIASSKWDGYKLASSMALLYPDLRPEIKDLYREQILVELGVRAFSSPFVGIEELTETLLILFPGEIPKFQIAISNLNKTVLEDTRFDYSKFSTLRLLSPADFSRIRLPEIFWRAQGLLDIVRQHIDAFSEPMKKIPWETALIRDALCLQIIGADLVSLTEDGLTIVPPNRNKFLKELPQLPIRRAF